ncbi:MAG TPA: hypothetical protein VEX63_13170, partial [Flavisolibacter sp.]|nr:hypothetical protein [Flavisolibacter sp.]
MKQKVKNHLRHKRNLTVAGVHETTAEYILHHLTDNMSPADHIESLTVLYVEKRFTGVAGVTVTAAGLSSTNVSYNEQLQKALVGDSLKPFPCIWSAQKKAKELINVGSSSVNIVIKSGYTVTIGSPTTTQNGNTNLTPGVNEASDIRIANVDNDFKALSLAQHGINYIFEQNTQIINICKSYNIPFIRIDKQVGGVTVDWTEHRTNIFGKAQFKWLYGQGDGFHVSAFQIYGVPGLKMKFEADLMLMNMWITGVILDYTDLHINWDKYWTYDNTLILRSSSDWETNGLTRPLLRLDVRDWRRGKNLFTGLTPAAADYWGGLRLDSAFGADALVNIDRWSINDQGTADGSLFRMDGFAVAKNNYILINVKKFEHYMSAGANQVTSGAIRYHTTSNGDATKITQSTNNHFLFLVAEAFTHVPIGQSLWSIGLLAGMCNSSFTLKVSGRWYNLSNVNPAIQPKLSYWGPEMRNQVTISGEFISVNGSVLVAAGGASGLNTDSIACAFRDCVFIQKTAGKNVMTLNSITDDWNISLNHVTLINDGVTEAISKTDGTIQVLFSN